LIFHNNLPLFVNYSRKKNDLKPKFEAIENVLNITLKLLSAK
jgi:hypothetical protein